MKATTQPRTVVDQDGHVVNVFDLYHRTTAAAAAEIIRSGAFISLGHDPEHAYFTNRPDGRNARQYGDVVVHVEVATHQAVELDSFRDGEVFYRVPLAAVTVLGLIEAT